MDKRLTGLISASVLAGSVVFGATSAFAQQSVVLDNFSTPQAEVIDSAADGTEVTGPSITLGNGASRTLSVDLVTQGVAGRDVTAEIAGGVYSLSNESQAFGDGMIDYTGLSLDLEFTNTIVVDVTSVDAAAANGTPIIVTLSTGSGPLSQTVNATSPGSVNFTFSGSGLSNVTGLNLEVDGSGTNGTDIDIDQISANGPGRCTIDGKTNLAANDPDCRVDICPIPGGEDLTADDPLCVRCQFNPNLLASNEACQPPPPAVPGITTSGLLISLLGLPLIAGFFASRRRNRK